MMERRIFNAEIIVGRGSCRLSKQKNSLIVEQFPISVKFGFMFVSFIKIFSSSGTFRGLLLLMTQFHLSFLKKRKF